MKNSTKNLAILVLAISSICRAVAGPVLPHTDLVLKYLKQPTLFAAKADSCKGIYMTPEDDNLDCWAAHVAQDLSKLPPDTRELVLDQPKRDAALSRCQALSMKERMDSRDCASAGQADTFVSLRLPRMKLDPVKFK